MNNTHARIHALPIVQENCLASYCEFKNLMDSDSLHYFDIKYTHIAS